MGAGDVDGAARGVEYCSCRRRIYRPGDLLRRQGHRRFELTLQCWMHPLAVHLGITIPAQQVVDRYPALLLDFTSRIHPINDAVQFINYAASRSVGKSPAFGRWPTYRATSHEHLPPTKKTGSRSPPRLGTQWP